MVHHPVCVVKSSQFELHHPVLLSIHNLSYILPVLLSLNNLSYSILSVLLNLHNLSYIILSVLLSLRNLSYILPVLLSLHNLSCGTSSCLSCSGYGIFHPWRGPQQILQEPGNRMRFQLIEECYRQNKKHKSSLLFGGEELIQFFAALEVLPRTILKNCMNSSFSS